MLASLVNQNTRSLHEEACFHPYGDPLGLHPLRDDLPNHGQPKAEENKSHYAQPKGVTYTSKAGTCRNPSGTVRFHEPSPDAIARFGKDYLPCPLHT